MDHAMTFENCWVGPSLPDPMDARAAKLWPDSEYNRREWKRAVSLVRDTKRGWVCDIKPKEITNA